MKLQTGRNCVQKIVQGKTRGRKIKKTDGKCVSYWDGGGGILMLTFVKLCGAVTTHVNDDE